MIPPQPKLPEYMTYREDRSPKFKGHINIGHVKNAVNMVTEARILNWNNVTKRYDRTPSQVFSAIQVFKLEEGEWKLLWDFPKGFLQKDLPWLQ